MDINLKIKRGEDVQELRYLKLYTDLKTIRDGQRESGRQRQRERARERERERESQRERMRARERKIDRDRERELD